MADNGCGTKIAPLTPQQARNTLAARLGPVADRIRQLATNLGIRPYRVFLIHTRWTGEERGMGTEVIFREQELLPTPRVEMLTNAQASPFPAGTLERGVLKVDRISTCFTEDALQGTDLGERVDEATQFYWEIREDSRHVGEIPARRRFRFLAAHHKPDSAEWIAYVERMGEDRDRFGTPGSSPDVEGP